MSRLSANRIYSPDDTGHPTDVTIAMIHPASRDSVLTVLSADPDDENGRSQFMWVRLGNGDLVLGVFPQGNTYFACEVDASTPNGI